MGVVGGSQFRVLLVGGYNLLSAKVKGFSDEVEVELEPSEGLGDDWRESAPTGMRKATLTQGSAFFTTAAAGIHEAMKDAPLTPRLVVWAMAGNAVGALFSAVQGAFTMAYGVLSTGAQLTKANVKYVVTGQLDAGVILQAHGAVTADGDNASVDYTLDPTQTVIPVASATKANPCVVTTSVPHGLTTGDLILMSGNTLSGPSINSEQAVTVVSTTTFSVAVNTSGSSGAGTGGSFVRANSSAGGVGYQVASAFSGLTGYVGTIRDSADDAIYADLITFANVTAAPAAERATVAGVVDRYLRYTKDVTGTGSVTVFAGFKRN